MKKVTFYFFILVTFTSCYKKKHEAVKAYFTLDKAIYVVSDTITAKDYSNGGKIVEYNFGDGTTEKGAQTLLFKHKYNSSGTYTVTAKAYEHVEGLHPHSAKSNSISKTITVN